MKLTGKQRSELLILAVLILLLSLFLILRNRDRLRYDLPEWEVSSDRLIRIVINPPGKPAVELQRREEIWQILPEDRPASREEMSRLLEQLSLLQPVDILSEKGPYDRYGLRPEQAVILTLTDGTGDTAVYYAGQASSSGNYSYLRRGSDPAVYSVRGSLPELLDVTPEGLREKQVLDFAADELKALTVLAGERRTEVRKENGVWKDSGGREYDPTEMSGFINRMSRLKCLDFTESPASGAPVLSVIFSTGTGNTRLDLLEERETGFLARVSDIQDTFMITRFDGERIRGLFFPEE